MDYRHCSLQGCVLLRALEGVQAMLYVDSAGLGTIGVGHRLTQSELTSGKIAIVNVITAQPEIIRYREGLKHGQIEALFVADLEPVEACINTHVSVPLNQHQYDSLCCLVFNIGCGAFMGSTLLKVLNQGRYADVPIHMARWVYSRGYVISGLAKRRQREIALWNAASTRTIT